MAKRRPNGGGAIAKRTDSRYQSAAYVTDTDGNRVRKYVYGTTWDEANEKLGNSRSRSETTSQCPREPGRSVSGWLLTGVHRQAGTGAQHLHQVRVQDQAVPAAAPGQEAVDKAHAGAGPYIHGHAEG